jgi:hypothetical protein
MQRIEDPIYKRAILSLELMALFLMAQFFSFVLDRIVVIISSTTFSPFFYIGWTFGICSLVMAYLGYIRPKGMKNAES